MALYDSILVTGGNGMLAHAFRAVLDEWDLDGTIVCRADCDVADPAAVGAAFERLKPTLLIKCAA